ncbi:TIGR03617 family F420-dependent LLM class oxidoreductase [Candidatus Poriferisodalis sp.]|uniref:TIGR03617 family F420-dependent LLM class oxidoreductase n=1 Tax=Candidatus Poriferisodalis sp. TaxID=3101277 RepID=UPI003B01FFAD
MELDLMTGSSTWSDAAELARTAERVGFSGMLYTETGQVPWMQLAAAAMAAPSLTFTTGIAVAFPRSPMVSAQIAWELAGETQGRFRLGLGSQVKGHIVRRYAAEFERPAARMRDYVGAVKACLRAFRGEERLSHSGEFFELSLLPPQWTPRRHDYGDVKVDISSVGPIMNGVAGEVADGVHVHPMHTMHYINERLLPEVARGAERAGRDTADIDLIVPVFAAPGDTPEELAPLIRRAKIQIAFYGTTPNYSFQFTDLGYEGVTEVLRKHMSTGDIAAMAGTITDDMLAHFAVIGPWDEMADRLADRYGGTAARVVMYLAEEQLRSDPETVHKWGEVAQAIRSRKTP